MPIRYIAITGLLAASLTATPAQSQSLRLGTSVGYEYGSAIPTINGFEAYSKGRTSLYALEVYVGIPVGWLTVYPSYTYALPLRRSVARNIDGDYIPDGYQISRPAGADNPAVIYGDDYYDLSSEIDLTQQSRGAYVMLNLGGGLEIGSGYFRIQKNVSVYSEILYDEYYFDSSADNFDKYIYWDTYFDRVDVQSYHVSSKAIPFVVQWRNSRRGYSTGTQIAYWKGDEGRSISIKYSVGFNL